MALGKLSGQVFPSASRKFDVIVRWAEIPWGNDTVNKRMGIGRKAALPAPVTESDFTGVLAFNLNQAGAPDNRVMMLFGNDDVGWGAYSYMPAFPDGPGPYGPTELVWLYCAAGAYPATIDQLVGPFRVGP